MEHATGVIDFNEFKIQKFLNSRGLEGYAKFLPETFFGIITEGGIDQFVAVIDKAVEKGELYSESRDIILSCIEALKMMVGPGIDIAVEIYQSVKTKEELTEMLQAKLDSGEINKIHFEAFQHLIEAK